MSAVVHLNTGFYTGNDTRYVFLDGAACKKIDDCYERLQEQLSLPAYFGKNLDALEEVLDDLEWIKEKKVCIIVFNVAGLLPHDPLKKKSFIDILHNAGNKKIQVIYPGKPE